MTTFKRIIKNIFDFMHSSELKTRLIKIGLVLAFYFGQFFFGPLRWVMFSLAFLFIAFEFSASSFIWIVIFSVLTGCVGFTVNEKLYFFYNYLIPELIIVLVVKLLIDIFKKRISFKNKQTIAILSVFLIFAVYTLLPFCRTYKFFSQLAYIGNLLLIILMFIYLKEINVKSLLIEFVTIITLLSSCYYIVDLFGVCSFDEFTAHTFNGGSVVRFIPLSYDPNIACGILISAILALFILYKQGAIKKPVYFVTLFILGFYSLKTLSKAGVLILALFATFVVCEIIVQAIKRKNAKLLIDLAWYALTLALILGVGCRYTYALFARLFNPAGGWWSEGNNINVDSVTTGRFSIWISTLKEFFSSWQLIFFGSGTKDMLLAYRWGGGLAHSMVIEYLYRYGIIGFSLLLSLFIIAIWPHIKKAKVYNFVPTILITGFFCSMGTISPKYLFIFVICHLTLCYNSLSKKEEQQKLNYEMIKN